MIQGRIMTGRKWAAAVAALLLTVATGAKGLELSAPFSLESSQVLPPGVRSPRYLSVSLLLDQRFSPSGGLQTLGDRLNKTVSWQDVLDSQQDQAQRNVIRSILNDHGIPFAGKAGDATGLVTLRVNVQVAALAWGLSDKLTIGVAVPIVKAQVSNDTGFIRSTDGQKFVDGVCETSPERCNDAARKLNDATNHKLQRLGYQPIRSETISNVGDVQLVGKYLLHRNDESGLAAKLTLTLPTGTAPNPDKALDITTGDNRFKIGALFIYDHALGNLALGDWGATLYAGYTALLPSHQIKRLPTSGDDSLSVDKEELVRKLGHLVSAGASVQYAVERVGLTLSAGYSAQALSRTGYSGSSADPYTQWRYGLLGDLEPDQVLHAAVFTVGFSTIEWYRKKKFFLPFQLNAAYSRPFAGRNAPTNDVVAGEMVLFL